MIAEEQQLQPMDDCRDCRDCHRCHAVATIDDTIAADRLTDADAVTSPDSMIASSLTAKIAVDNQQQ